MRITFPTDEISSHLLNMQHKMPFRVCQIASEIVGYTKSQS